MANDALDLARRHLRRVQAARNAVTDWDDLSLYGFYCLEAAVVAAAEHLEWNVRRAHADKEVAAERLAAERGLPNIGDLLSDLNAARKAAAYGDSARPEMDRAQVVARIEQYVDAVARLLEGAT